MNRSGSVAARLPENQRDDLLAFAGVLDGVLDGKLSAIAQVHDTPEALVREALVLHRLPSTSQGYWHGRAGVGFALRRGVSSKRSLTRCNVPWRKRRDAVRWWRTSTRGGARTFTLRRHIGGSYLDLLLFFLDHRRFMRSRRVQREAKSPREVMTGQEHPHWLTLLGLGPLQPLRT